MENIIIKKFNRKARRRLIVIGSIITLVLAITIMMFIINQTNSISKTIPVTGITIDNNQYNIEESYLDEFVPIEIKYTILPANATNKEVQFTIEKDGATIENGTSLTITNNVITAVTEEGEYVIIVSTVDGNYKDQLNVIITKKIDIIPADRIDIASDITVEAGEVEMETDPLTKQKMVKYITNTPTINSNMTVELFNGDEVANVDYNFDARIDNPIATVRYNHTTKQLNIIGRQYGTATITITATAEGYQQVIYSFTIKIEEPSKVEDTLKEITVYGHKNEYFENEVINIVFMAVFTSGTIDTERIIEDGKDNFTITTIIEENGEETLYTTTIKYNGEVQKEITYTVKKIVISNIELIQNEIIITSQIDNLEVIITYNNRTNETKKINEIYDCSNFNSEEEGIQTIDIDYQSFKTSLNISVIGVKEVSCDVESGNSYKIGDLITLRLVITFNSTADITETKVENIVVDCADDCTEILHKKTFTYYHYQYEFSYNVVHKTVEAIQINSISGLKDVYRENETIDDSSIELNITYIYENSEFYPNETAIKKLSETTYQSGVNQELSNQELSILELSILSIENCTNIINNKFTYKVFYKVIDSINFTIEDYISTYIELSDVFIEVIYKRYENKIYYENESYSLDSVSVQCKSGETPIELESSLPQTPGTYTITVTVNSFIQEVTFTVFESNFEHLQTIEVVSKYPPYYALNSNIDLNELTFKFTYLINEQEVVENKKYSEIKTFLKLNDEEIVDDSIMAMDSISLTYNDKEVIFNYVCGEVTSFDAFYDRNDILIVIDEVNYQQYLSSLEGYGFTINDTKTTISYGSIDVKIKQYQDISFTIHILESKTPEEYQTNNQFIIGDSFKIQIDVYINDRIETYVKDINVDELGEHTDISYYGYMFSYTGINDDVKEITVEGLKSAYYYQDVLDYSALKFTVVYKNTSPIILSWNEISSASKNQIINNLDNGIVYKDFSFTITYDDFTQSFDVSYIEKEIKDYQYSKPLPLQLYEEEDINNYLVGNEFTINFTNNYYQSLSIVLNNSNYNIETTSDGYQLTIDCGDDLVLDIKLELSVVKREIIDVKMNVTTFYQYQALPKISYTIYYQKGLYEEEYTTIISSPTIITQIDNMITGDSIHTIKIDDNEYDIQYNVLALSTIYANVYTNLYFLKNQNIDEIIESLQVTALYSDNTRIVLSSFNHNLNTSAVGDYSAIIEFGEKTTTIAYSVYEPLTISSDDETVITTKDTITIQISVSKYYSGSNELLFIQSNDYQITSELKTNASGYQYYDVQIKLLKIGTYAIEFYLEDAKQNSVQTTIEYLDLDAVKLIINGTDYIITNQTARYYLTYQGGTIDFEYQILLSGEGCQLINNQNDTFQLIAGSNATTVTIIINVGGSEVARKVINIVPEIRSLSFVDDKKYGFVGDILTIGTLDFENGTITGGVKKVFDVIAGGTVITANDRLIFTSSDEEIAKFDGYSLIVYKEGEVTLTVSDKANPNIKKEWKIRCVEAVNVYNYEQLKTANEKYPTVIRNDIMVGEELVVLTKDSNGLTTRTLATTSRSVISSRQSKSTTAFTSTWDTDFLKNVAKDASNPKEEVLYYCLSINYNMYGNGYQLNTYNITTLRSLFSSQDGLPRFSGPLKYFEVAGATVYGQDNISFRIQDDVTVDNVQLYGCDDDYLISSEGYDYSKLEKVGTTVEVVGDNVSILNSRIRNGRNCLRIYGDEEDLDKVINVTISSCIIQNAREFLVKIGVNKEKSSNAKIKYDGEVREVRDLYDEGKSAKDVMNKVTQDGNRSFIFNSTSPALTDAEGKNYAPRKDYQNDQYFMDNYVLTRVTIKNSLLENARLFAIALESKFAGPILGGLKFVGEFGGISFDPNILFKDLWNYCYDISGTSYSALLKLEGDVKIYNWMKLSEINTDSLVKPGNISNTIIIKFDLATMISNVKKQEGFNDITVVKDGTEYVNGNIIFYGGGKNYHMIDMSKLNGASDLKEYLVPFSYLGEDLMARAFPWLAGNEPFRFYMFTDINKYFDQGADDNNWITISE